MALADDPWIAANSPLSPERLHAIGLITFRWNECEFWQFQLFRCVSELAQSEAWAFVFDLGDEAISVRIKTLMTIREYHKGGRALIENALDIYGYCRQNRNSLAHAWSHGKQNGEAILARKSKKPSDIDPEAFPADLTTLKRVADEIEVLETRLWLLCCLLEEGTISTPPPSLGILPLPSLLWRPLPPPNTKPPRPPQSSSASRRKTALARKS
jgi:hypothetical protein